MFFVFCVHVFSLPSPYSSVDGCVRKQGRHAANCRVTASLIYLLGLDLVMTCCFSFFISKLGS